MVEWHLTTESLREQEDQLFKDWSAQAGYPLIRDGAMAQYANTPRRLLVMLKEPNDPEHAFSDGDLREAASWYDDADLCRETWTTIARWTAPLLDGRTIDGPVPRGDWSALIRQTEWIVLAGGLPLILATLGFTFLGERLRDIFDPKLRRDR